jgi:hypothetical protein
MGMRKVEKIGAAGKRKHMVGIGLRIKRMSNVSRAAHIAAAKAALRGK